MKTINLIGTHNTITGCPVMVFGTITAHGCRIAPPFFWDCNFVSQETKISVREKVEMEVDGFVEFGALRPIQEILEGEKNGISN